MKNRVGILQLLALVSFLVQCGCVQKMGTEGRLRPLEDHQVTRATPEGTIAQTEKVPLNTTQKIPTQITYRFLTKGREQFNIYCMPCHGAAGYGNGMIVQRGFLAPPSYHIDRLRKAPDAHYFDVMTRGFGAMYSYADRISAPDRWAIVAYIRALQLSQNAHLPELTKTDKLKLREVDQ